MTEFSFLGELSLQKEHFWYSAFGPVDTKCIKSLIFWASWLRQNNIHRWLVHSTINIYKKNLLGSISYSPFISQGLVCCGSGEPGVDEHRSFVLYHSNSPRWAEQIKLPIPLEMFHGTHLRFELRHCSSKTPLHLHFFLENWFYVYLLFYLLRF